MYNSRIDDKVLFRLSLSHKDDTFLSFKCAKSSCAALKVLTVSLPGGFW